MENSKIERFKYRKKRTQKIEKYLNKKIRQEDRKRGK